METPTRAMKLAKEKSQQFFACESEKFSYKIEKFLTVYHGYNQIKPKIFPKRLSTMFSADIVPTDEDCRSEFFSRNTTTSLRRHQREKGTPTGGNRSVDTSSKIRVILPAAQTTAKTGQPIIRLLASPRTKRPGGGGPRTPTRVVLTTPDSTGTAKDSILCSSVMLTYREELFFPEKDMVRKESDV